MAKKVVKKAKENKKVEVKESKKKVKKTSFLKGVKQEMSKVKWPTFKEIIKYTVATMVLIVFLGLFFEGLNLLSSLVKGLFN